MLLNDAIDYQHCAVSSAMIMEHWWSDADGRTEVLAEKPVLQNLQTSPGSHPALCSRGIMGSFSRGKAGDVWS
jgi:hypothetical protein